MTMKQIAERIEAKEEGKNGNSSSGSRSNDNNEIYGKVRFSFITGGSFVVSLIASIFIMIAGLITPIFFYIGIILFCVSAIVLLFGHLVVHEMEIVIIQRWGAYWKRLKPGLNFIVPGIDKVIYKDPAEKTFPTMKIMVIPLLKGVKVEFEDSTETGIIFGANIKIVDPKKSTYSAEDLIKYVTNLLENPVKSALGNIFVDEALKQRDDIIASVIDDLNNKKIGVFVDKRGNEQSLTGSMSLENAGIELESLFFNDVEIANDTLARRKERQTARQAVVVAKLRNDLEIANNVIEKTKIIGEEYKKQQTVKEKEGIRGGLEAIAGIDETDPKKSMTIEQAAEWMVKMKKYGYGVSNVSEINIKGDPTNPQSVVASLAAIAGETFKESKGEGKKPTKNEDTNTTGLAAIAGRTFKELKEEGKKPTKNEETEL